MKVELDTPDKPEVVGIAARLRIDQDAVTGKLLRIWAWADRNSVDGQQMLITPEFIDRLTNKRGFATAMQAVGWLIVENGFLTFPGFTRHNGSTAKGRAVGNRRVAKHRNAKGNGKTVTPAFRKPLPEKRREESNTPLPPEGGESEGADGLISKIKSLRREWQASPMLSAREERHFRKNQDLIGLFTPEAWDQMRDFLAARLPEGSAYFQPILLQKFLENPGGVLGHAQAWKSKQRPKLSVVPTPPSPDDPPLSKEELAEFFRKPLPHPEARKS